MKPRRVQRQHIVRAESPYCGILRSLPAIPLNVDAPIAELQKLGTTIGYGHFQVAEEAAVEVSSTSRRAGAGGIGARTLRKPFYDTLGDLTPKLVSLASRVQP